GVLLIAFGGITDHLIPLFAVGAFLAFTLSQAGMVAHWWHARKQGEKGAWASMFINGLGAVSTGVALVIVLVSKFLDGAWITVALIPAFLLLFYAVRRHYRKVALEVHSCRPLDVKELKQPLVVLLTRGWSKITRKALRFGMKISPDVFALHV